MAVFSGRQTEAPLHLFDPSSAQHLVLKGGVLLHTSYSLECVFSYTPFLPRSKGTADAASESPEN